MVCLGNCGGKRYTEMFDWLTNEWFVWVTVVGNSIQKCFDWLTNEWLVWVTVVGRGIQYCLIDWLTDERTFVQVTMVERGLQ